MSSVDDKRHRIVCIDAWIGRHLFVLAIGENTQIISRFSFVEADPLSKRKQASQNPPAADTLSTRDDTHVMIRKGRRKQRRSCRPKSDTLVLC